MMTLDSISEDELEVAYALLLLSKGPPKQSKKKAIKLKKKIKKQPKKKRKTKEEDDTEETLRLMLWWNKVKPEIPLFLHELDVVGVCSKPLRKQLTESDVKADQCRLMLGKKEVEKMMLHVMEESDRFEGNELEVLVYGPDMKVHKLKFKVWNKKTYVLKSNAWNQFVIDYELKMHCDFLTIWMFKHKETREICFAIDKIWFSNVEKPLSKRILKAAF